MSEIKRVALTTLEPQKVNDKVIKKVCKTVRISVILPESNEDNCPEYNYKDQLAAVVKKKVKPPKDSNNLENGLDPFGENDEDVRRIALEMEAKYGSGVTKKKRKDRKDDYADIGMGYDESDSFIDNTDGYDEIIPKNVTTLHGGFYINSGALEFKTDDEASPDASSSASSSSGSSSASESDGEDKQKLKNRKRILEPPVDSDSDTANPAQKAKKLKVQPPTTSMQHAIKKKLFSSSKIQVKKRRPIDPLKKTVKDLLREKREDLNISSPNELKVVEDNIEKESSKENKKPMNITSVTDAIESVLKQVVEDDYETNKITTPVEINTNAVLPQNKIDPPISQVKEKDKPSLTRLEKEEIVKLPENLPADVEAILSKLKDAALNYKGEGKKAFFTQDVNALLLNLEKKTKIISKSSRVKVYEQLAQYVNCTKDTLIRRARILDLEDHERRLRGLQIKLKDCIDATMPTLEENFQLESQKVLQKKFSQESENNQELKSLKMPRRKFIWSEECKKYLKDAVSVKKRCLMMEGKYKDNLIEEQLVDYLRTQIQPLWPEGWMYLNTIKKILNRMQDHSKSTSFSANSSCSSNNSTSVNPKHSNLSITPVTNGKINSEKPEITNTITVTKVVNNNEVIVVDGPNISKNLEINHVNQVEEKNTENTKQEIYINEHTKSNESIPKVEQSDFTVHPKKPDVFKPYVDDPPLPQPKQPVSDTRNYQKPHKQNEMFKPYADEVIAVDRIIPDKPTVATYEEIPQYHDEDKFVGLSSYVEMDRHGHSYSDKEKLSGQLHQEKDIHTEHSYQEKDKYSEISYSDKDKPSGHSHQEKDKISGYSYLNKEKPSGHSYQERDNLSGHSYPDKEKPSGHSYQEKDKLSRHSYPDKEKSSGHSYQEKDKLSGHSYQEKDKLSGHSYPDKENPSGHSYPDKEKPSGHSYQERDKLSGHSYPDKEKSSGHSYQEKDKASGHSHQEKDNLSGRSYQEKDKYSGMLYPEIEKPSGHSYQEKNKEEGKLYHEKDKHGAYREKNKHGGHSYYEKDKHGGRSYQEKDKHGGRSYQEKDKHGTHSHHEKDKHGAHREKNKHGGHSYKDKEKSNLVKENLGPAIHNYTKKDQYAPHTYPAKEEQVTLAYKHNAHTYADKEKYTYTETDKRTLHTYPEKENTTSHSYSEKHSSHSTHPDKHSSHLYTDKDKHNFCMYSDKDKNTENPKNHVEVTSQLDVIPHVAEKLPNLSKPIEKPTDLSKFQMFKPYSDSPKSIMDDLAAYQLKDINCYIQKEERHQRTVEIPQDTSNFANKGFVGAGDFIPSSTKHRSSTSHPYPVGSSVNELSSKLEDNGAIVKNHPTKDKLPREDKKETQIGMVSTAHCQGVKRKLLETYTRNSNEINPANYYSPTVSNHSEYVSSTPLVTSKSDGDGQKDIQMVMENLKALQKLSCSPVKNDNSSSSPVSVIAFNKNFASSKTSSNLSHSSSRNDNNRGDFTGGFQEEFQKAFINSLQQMAAGNNKSGYNNGS